MKEQFIFSPINAFHSLALGLDGETDACADVLYTPLLKMVAVTDASIITVVPQMSPPFMPGCVKAGGA